VDLYENAKTIPFSGHAGAFKELIGGAGGPNSIIIRLTKWPQAVVDSCTARVMPCTTSAPASLSRSSRR
jgi:hypothetical protein